MHNAITAWEGGNTGAGEIIAIIDTGIDQDSPEFAGRLHPDSQDVAGNASVEAIDDHGTNVALVAAAARDDTGVVGIAFDAQILALRGDAPGTCTVDEDDADLEGCAFFDRDIADGVDQAVASGATVINISLGGGAPTARLRTSITTAANAGIVIVVSAGNDGDSTDPNVDPNQPDPFAEGLLAAGGGNVIIVGSVDPNGEFSDFSNRAGNLAASYLTAQGERICCVYNEGVLEVTTDANGNQFVTLFSGTSFSAPQVAGAVALLAQAFPNLTGAEIVEILLDTAADAGDAGTDAVFGRGTLDIAAAVSPQGTMSIAGTTMALAIGDNSGVASTAMGDALTDAPLQTVLTDKYDRAYNFDLGSRFRSASVAPKLEGAVANRGRRLTASGNGVSLAFRVEDAPTSGFAQSGQLRLSQDEAEQARVLAARIALKLAPDMDVAFGFAESSYGLVGQLQGQSRPAFLIAQTAGTENGFFRRSDAAFALRHKLGNWGLTVSADRGDAILGGLRISQGFRGRTRERYGISNVGLFADRRIGSIETAFGLTMMQEEQTVLGAYFDRSIGAGGANTLFFDGSASFPVAGQWRLGGAFRLGQTRADRVGLISSGSNFASNAWSFDVSRRSMFQAGDSFGFRVTQPLRVEKGGLSLNLPVAYEYSTESAIFDRRAISLSPGGREVMSELAWSGAMFGGNTSASLFYRRQPGHIATASDDAGVAIKWNRGF